MTPKQKAEQLVKRYSIFAWNENLFDSDIAKKCSLMVADDILYQAENWGVVSVIFYWQQVKTEIQSL
jgi:hypothetical protein